MRKIFLIAAFILVFLYSRAQNKPSNEAGFSHGFLAAQPFLYSINTLTSENQRWNIHYSGSYAERASGQFGYNGLGQQFGVKGYLGNRFTLYATASVGFANNSRMSSAQQAEVIRDLIGGKNAAGFF